MKVKPFAHQPDQPRKPSSQSLQSTPIKHTVEKTPKTVDFRKIKHKSSTQKVIDKLNQLKKFTPTKEPLQLKSSTSAGIYTPSRGSPLNPTPKNPPVTSSSRSLFSSKTPTKSPIVNIKKTPRETPNKLLEQAARNRTPTQVANSPKKLIPSRPPPRKAAINANKALGTPQVQKLVAKRRINKQLETMADADYFDAEYSSDESTCSDADSESAESFDDDGQYMHEYRTKKSTPAKTHPIGNKRPLMNPTPAIEKRLKSASSGFVPASFIPSPLSSQKLSENYFAELAADRKISNNSCKFLCIYTRFSTTENEHCRNDSNACKHT